MVTAFPISVLIPEKGPKGRRGLPWPRGSELPSRGRPTMDSALFWGQDAGEDRKVALPEPLALHSVTRGFVH